VACGGVRGGVSSAVYARPESRSGGLLRGPALVSGGHVGRALPSRLSALEVVARGGVNPRPGRGQAGLVALLRGRKIWGRERG